MRSREKQRVICQGCGWSGGRATGPDILVRPCYRCSGPVEAIGPVYVEERRWAGCRCGWYGEVATDRVGQPCCKCSAATGLAMVVLEDGTVLAS